MSKENLVNQFKNEILALLQTRKQEKNPCVSSAEIEGYIAAKRLYGYAKEKPHHRKKSEQMGKQLQEALTALVEEKKITRNEKEDCYSIA